MNKKTIALAVAVTVLGAAAFTGSNAYAQSTTEQNPMASVIQKIAQKFNLKESDVQAVFDEHRTEKQAEMTAQFEAKLTQAVTDGKITEAQKQLIVAKHKEMVANKSALNQTATKEERKAAMEKEHQALSEWATQNNIDLSYLMPFGKGRGHEFGGHGKFVKPQSTPSSSTTN